LKDLRKAKLLRDTIFPAVEFGATDVVIPSNFCGAPWNWFEAAQYRYVGCTSYMA